MDLRQSASNFPPGSFDVVLSNPPYRKSGSGRINVERQKAIARHELCADLCDIFAAARHLLPHGGRAVLVYPATRLPHLLGCARKHDFSPKRLTIIYSYPGGPGKLLHLESVKGGGEELTVAPPFFVYDTNGRYSEAMDALYAE